MSDITLYPIGGVARLGQRPKTPGQEFLIAIAGPAVNVVLALVIGAVATGLFGQGVLLETLELGRSRAPSGVTLWAWLAAANVALAVFNMLPALPMDGGRVLRAVLAWPFGQQKATKAAAVIARVLSVGLFGLGLYSGNFVLPFIAVFVFLGAGAEVRDANFQRMLDGVKSGDAVNGQMVRLSPSTTVSEAVQALMYWPAQAFAVEHSGELAGVVTRAAILESVQRDGGVGYIAGLMKRAVPRVDARESLEVARQRMGEGGFVAVFDAGLYLGLITDAELAHQLSVLQAFQRGARTARFAGGRT